MVNISLYHTLVFDFDGVFTNNYVVVNEFGEESVQVSRADGLAVDLLRRTSKLGLHSLDIFILSSEKNSVVEARARKMSIECIQGTRDKQTTLDSRFRMTRTSDPNPYRGLIYFGNDLNDLIVMQKAGLSFCPSDAHERVKAVSTHVLRNRGGHNFVREGVELLLNVEGLSSEELCEYISDS
jgi:3-deoxy-D-manno-octulosonate 8-phosphate phosphatase (KDO 8-P phosphatase)